MEKEIDKEKIGMLNKSRKKMEDILIEIEKNIIEIEKKIDIKILDEMYKKIAIFGKTMKITEISNIVKLVKKVIKKLSKKEIIKETEAIEILIDSNDLLKYMFEKVYEKLGNYEEDGKLDFKLKDLGEKELNERFSDCLKAEEEVEIEKKVEEKIEIKKIEEVKKEKIVKNKLIKFHKEKFKEYTEEIVNMSFGSYIDELDENIQVIETNLIEVENKIDKNKVNTIMRGFHSIKGDSRLILSLDMENRVHQLVEIVENISHDLESLMIEVKEGKAKDNDYELFYNGLDLYKEILSYLKEPYELEMNLKIFDRLQKRLNDNGEELEKINKIEEKQEIEKETKKIKMLMNFLNQYIEYAEKMILNDKWKEKQFDRMNKTIKKSLKSMEMNEEAELIIKFEEVVKKGDKEEIKKILEKIKNIKTVEKNEAEKKDEDKEESKEKLGLTDIKKERKTNLTSQFIKLGKDKVDKMMNLVSELITLKNRQLRLVKKVEDKELAGEMKKFHGDFERLSDEFQGIVMSMRMVSVDKLFNRYQRTIRDMSKSLKKEIKLEIEGAETEIDKDVLDILYDPINHMVRNSIDHGLETPEERLELGKEKVGKIYLRAYYKGGNVVIEIEDDGKGMDVNAIIGKIIGKGLRKLSQLEKMSKNEIYQFIFRPGFSTATKVTNISGRGVGMDVVKTNVESVGGTISVESEIGKGSKFTLKIPLSLSVLKGMMIKKNNRRYILPLDIIKESVKIKKEQVHKHKQTYIAMVRNEPVPILNTEGLMGLSTKISLEKKYEYDLLPLVIINLDGVEYGIIVDGFIEQGEYVLKPMPDLFNEAKVFAGTTIMGDGSLVLILNPQYLL